MTLNWKIIIFSLVVALFLTFLFSGRPTSDDE